jgi:hypothetical protein
MLACQTRQLSPHLGKLQRWYDYQNSEEPYSRSCPLGSLISPRNGILGYRVQKMVLENSFSIVKGEEW